VGCSIGGDTGEAAAGNGLFLLVRPSCGVGNAERVRLVVGVQASCWVLREQARGACLGFSGFRPRPVTKLLNPVGPGGPGPGCGCVVALWLVGLVVV
jgi:hypothetical protein